MIHDRTWHIRRADNILLPANLASLLDKCPKFVLCQAFVLMAGERTVYLLNDSSSGNSAQEYAAVIVESKMQVRNHRFLCKGYQFESVTTSWATRPESLEALFDHLKEGDPIHVPVQFTLDTDNDHVCGLCV